MDWTLMFETVLSECALYDSQNVVIGYVNVYELEGYLVVFRVCDENCCDEVYHFGPSEYNNAYMKVKQIIKNYYVPLV
jgi:glyoxylate carboligase